MAHVVRHLYDLPGGRYAPGDRVAALTFDDGPAPTTLGVLDALAACDAPATFFVVGNQIGAYPDCLRQIVAAGHTIGSHSWTHTRTRELTDDAVRDEANRTAEAVRAATNATVRYARPPYRPDDALRLAELLAPLGFEAAVTWSIDPRDWAETDADAITASTIGAFHPGAIVLLHAGAHDRSATVEAVPRIVREGRALGYRFVAL